MPCGRGVAWLVRYRTRVDGLMIICRSGWAQRLLPVSWLGMGFKRTHLESSSFVSPCKDSPVLRSIRGFCHCRGVKALIVRR